MTANHDASPEDRSSDDVWVLAKEWSERINHAYDETIQQVLRFQRAVFIYGGLLLVVLASAAGLESLAGKIPDGTSMKPVLDIFSRSFMFLFICILFIAPFDLFRRFQRMMSAKNELTDLYYIADELFQMVISTEENLHSDNRYKYLTNHVRVLEIKHLLHKVKRITNKKSILWMTD
jgi:hypothetical protein